MRVRETAEIQGIAGDLEDLMKMAGDCDAFEDEFAYIFELTDNRIRKPSLLRGFLPIILAFPNLMPSVEAVSGL